MRQKEPQITHDDYARIAPGKYRAYCRAARIYFDPGYRKWLCVLRWDIFDPTGFKAIARVPQWLYIGRRQHCTRRSQFWREYCRANGGPPARQDRMGTSVFMRRIASVLVRDTKRPELKVGEPPLPHSPYSVVEQVLSYETGGAREYLCTPVSHPSLASVSECSEAR